jgi:hypothetical protein
MNELKRERENLELIASENFYFPGGFGNPGMCDDQ